MKPYYSDDRVTLYHGMASDAYMIECHAWHSVEQSGRGDTGLGKKERMCPKSLAARLAISSQMSTSRLGSGTAWITTPGPGTRSPSRVAVSAPSGCTRTQSPASRAVHQSLSDITRAETRRTTLRRTSPSFAAGATCERTVV